MDIRCALKMGDRFHHLEVVSWDKDKKCYICKCDCGSLVTTTSQNLKTNTHKQSRKCSGKAASLNYSLPDNLMLKRAVIHDYKQSAKVRKLEYSLSEDEAIQLITANCTYCGSVPNNTKLGKSKVYIERKEIKYNGIDRTNNNEGYHLSNCVTCCDQCNRSK